MHRLRRNSKLLSALVAEKRRWRHHINKASPDLLLCLSDCAKNILAGNVTVNSKQYSLLMRHKQLLRAIRPRTSLKRIRSLLTAYATPCFLKALIEPALQLLP